MLYSDCKQCACSWIFQIIKLVAIITGEMSRIIVKQLPKNISEEKLRSLFGSKGTITDLQLKYTRDGKFRQFCFIGYRSDEEAQAAINFFDNTCIQTSRIRVSVCAALGDEDKPRAWSKYAKDSQKALGDQKNENKKTETKTKKKDKIDKVDEIFGKHKEDPEFQEFLKAHDRNRTLWANDAGLVTEMARKEDKAGDDEDEVEEIDETQNEKKQNHRENLKKKSLNISKDSDLSGNEEDQAAQSDVENEDEAETNEKLAAKPISDLEYMKSLIMKSASTDKKDTKAKPAKPIKPVKADLDLFTIKIQNVPYKTKRQEILKFFKPQKPYSVRLPANVHGFCYVGFKTEKEMAKAMLKNKSFIGGKQVFFSDFTEKNKITKAKQQQRDGAEQSDTAAVSGVDAKWAKQAESARGEEDISESGCLFFRNLAYTVTEDDLQKLFEKFGPVAEVNLPVDAVTRKIKGFGTVTFMMPEHAVMAFGKLDGTGFHGRLLHLIPGKSFDKEEEKEDETGLSFKEKKARKLKKAAQQSHNWNTLFLGQNAVAEILAKKYETTKEKLLDTSEGGSSAAVRMALGETQLVIEMRKFLEDAGINLNAFETPNVKRSKTIILAKNLPAETTMDELAPLFTKFGPVARFILPPSGVTAVIEFCDPSEARQAFKKLAYSKFKNLPLYLEWAPENAFATTVSGEPIMAKPEEVTPSINDEKPSTSKEERIEEDPTIESEAHDNEPPEPNTTLFLRNLNFKTVQEAVLNHFKHLGAIHTVEIAKRKDANNPQHKVSLGYGFIQFKKAATAEKALKNMQFTQIDGNQVELKRSDRTLGNATTTQRKGVTLTKQTGTKILVRNIPFQAKPKEVREIFKAFGEISSLRLPMKMTPGEDTHRGFGFVDFTTKSDAKKAFMALSQSTHLYGRRLVLEWASTTEDDVSEIRKRTAAQVSGGATKAKRGGKSIFDTEAHIKPSAGDDEEL